YIDAVLVGSLRESMILSQKAIFVLNATATSLPSEQGYQAIISALDMDKLSQNGIHLYPTPIDRIREERFAFIDLIAKTDKLYIGYPECEFDGAQNKPSQAINDICMAFSVDANHPIEPISLSERFKLENVRDENELIDAVGQSGNAFYTFLMNGGMANEDKNGFRKRVYATLSDEEKKVVHAKKEIIKEVPLEYTFHKKGEITSNASQLEQYFSCPYKHYLQSGLKLQERKEGALRVADVGDIIHEVLEIYFRSVAPERAEDGSIKKDVIRQLNSSEIEERIDDAIKKVFEGDSIQFLTKETMTKFLFERLKRESKRIALKLTDNVLKGDFTPSACELSFGGDYVCFDTPFGKISFSGKIDRIDTASIGGKDYAIAIDYKTGHVDADLSSVYYGKKMQLYLYLLAIRNGAMDIKKGDEVKRHFEPAGSFYLKINTGYTKAGNEMPFQGQFIFSAPMIKALDREKYEDALLKGEYATSNVLPIRFSIKNGEATTKEKKNKTSEEELNKAITYVEKLIPIALEEIGNGNVEKAPIGKDACEHCYVRVACGGCEEGDEREERPACTPLKVDIPEDADKPTEKGEDND
ncbi:MAG: PD-(D/E)XK nuclease family protein, partial [Clostridia bacterium]|nr:PD-(D/E)XK nuclease family protein [Clostridia bacterium]